MRRLAKRSERRSSPMRLPNWPWQTSPSNMTMHAEQATSRALSDRENAGDCDWKMLEKTRPRPLAAAAEAEAHVREEYLEQSPQI